jgi:heme-degrading monooxygenase HmoA
VIALHREFHTPAVRRRPGFVSKVLLQAEAEPERLVMLLTWESGDHASAWVALPEHDEIGARFHDLTVRGDAVAAAPRGGYRVVEVIGPEP